MVKVEKGILKPCPSCNGHNISWGGYYHISLICNDCGFEMFPFNEFASEEDVIKEWNELSEIDTLIKTQSMHIELAKDIADQCNKKRTHYEWIRSKIQNAKESFSQTQ